MKVVEDSPFFMKVYLSNCLTSLALFACSLNYNDCSLVAFKHKDHDYQEEENFLWRTQPSVSTLFQPPATVKRSSLLILSANVNHLNSVSRWTHFSLEMFILSLCQWMILSLGSLVQRDGVPFTNQNEVMKKNCKGLRLDCSFGHYLGCLFWICKTALYPIVGKVRCMM